MINLYRGPCINASYQVSVHLAEEFQRRILKCEKLADDRRRTTDDGRQVMAKASFASIVLYLILKTCAFLQYHDPIVRTTPLVHYVL